MYHFVLWEREGLRIKVLQYKYRAERPLTSDREMLKLESFNINFNLPEDRLGARDPEKRREREKNKEVTSRLQLENLFRLLWFK